MGGLIKGIAKYLNSSELIEAAQQKNVEQDAQLAELRVIQEQNKQLLMQQTVILE